MGIKLSKENICVNQIVGQKEENFTVEGDEIVPDIKPDILNIISANGNICIYKKEIINGKVKVEGSIYLYTLYMADDAVSSIRSINSSLNFTKTFDIENILPEMQLKTRFEIQKIESKMLNGRKISLNVKINSKIFVYSNEKIDVINGIEDIEDIQKLNNNYNINSLIGNGTTKVFGKDTIKINQEDNLTEMMRVNIDIVNKESKISYNKVLVKADANVKILYLTEDGRISSACEVLPLMGFIDIQNITEQNQCEILYEMKNIAIKPNNIEDHSIYVEIEMEITCNAFENKTVQIIQDLYSPTRNLEFKQKDVKIIQDNKSIKQIYNIRKQETIPEIGKNKIYDVEVNPIIINSQITNGKIMYEGEVTLKFLHETSGGILCQNVIEPFDFSIANDDITELSNVETGIEVISQDFIVLPDESIDIKIDLEFTANMYMVKKMNVISEVNENEERKKETFSIVIYYVKPGDSLWSIAKKFGSTVEEIIKINKIENENMIYPNEQLFIPR